METLETPENEDPNLTVTKTITKFVVARCVSGVVVTLLHNNVQTHTKGQKAQLYVGAFVVGAMVADKAEDWTNTQIDEIADVVRKIKGHFKKEAKAETEETPTE